MSFAATDFEFKNRFWIIGAVIFLAFFCYNIDHINITFALTQKILGPAVSTDSPIFDRYQLAIVTIGSLFVYLAALLRSWAESYLHSSIVHDAAIHSDQLVAEGPYRYVRNPLYLGNDLLALGLGVLAALVEKVGEQSLQHREALGRDFADIVERIVRRATLVCPWAFRTQWIRDHSGHCRRFRKTSARSGISCVPPGSGKLNQHPPALGQNHCAEDPDQQHHDHELDQSEAALKQAT